MTYEDYERLTHILWHCQLVFNNNGMEDTADKLQPILNELFANRHKKEVSDYKRKINRIIREAKSVEPNEMGLYPEI